MVTIFHQHMQAVTIYITGNLNSVSYIPIFAIDLILSARLKCTCFPPHILPVDYNALFISIGTLSFIFATAKQKALQQVVCQVLQVFISWLTSFSYPVLFKDIDKPV